MSPPERRTFVPSNPRRGRGGIRLSDPTAAQSPAPGGSWAGQRWIRLVELAAPPDRLAAGLELARAGATRELRLEPGRVTAVVAEKPGPWRNPELHVPRFTAEQWDRVVEALAEQTIYAAKLLSGELPANIEDVFGPLGLRLLPAEHDDVSPTCTCGDPAPQPLPNPDQPEGPPTRWCRHACCAAALLADRLQREPFLMFGLRGLEKDELLERLRQSRAGATARLRPASRAAPVFIPQGHRLETVRPEPLADCAEDFWHVGPGLADVETAPRPPEVRHGLLRRLGPSPFPKGGFPLIGLLATCYDLASNAALTADPEQQPPDDAPDAD